MLIYSKNNLDKFHSDQIWNDGAQLSFPEDGRSNNNEKNKMTSDIDRFLT